MNTQNKFFTFMLLTGMSLLYSQEVRAAAGGEKQEQNQKQPEAISEPEHAETKKLNHDIRIYDLDDSDPMDGVPLPPETARILSQALREFIARHCQDKE